MLEVAPDLRDRIAVVDGVSKSHAMTGWRIGWLLGPERLAAACTVIQSQVVSNPTAVAQHAALAALSGEQGCVEQMRAVFEQRRDRMVRGLKGIPGLSCRTPRGAFYVFADASGWLGRRAAGRALEDDAQVAQWLLQEARVAVVPGSAFGAPGFLRFSFAVSLERIESGLGRIAEAVESLG
jgi:aspartate aminotransferase